MRQAFAYGLDMDLAIREILHGGGRRMVSHHPPHHWAFPAGLNEYRYDPAKADALIRDAGYAKGGDGFYTRDGKPLAFSVVTNRGNKTREALLQFGVDEYKRLGVRVTARLEDFGALVDKLGSGSPDIEAWILGWTVGPDSDPFDIWHSSRIPDPATKRTGFNFGGFTAPGLDEAIERGRRGPDCSTQARRPHYATLNRILNEEQPYNFGWPSNFIYVVPSSLQNFAPGPFAEEPLRGVPLTHNVEQWWL